MRPLAKKLLKKEPLSLKAAKQLIIRAFDLPVEQVLYEEGRSMMNTAQSEGCRQRIEAFVKKNEEH
jgi:enoyl-CoA hydratase/carnithine racemase